MIEEVVGSLLSYADIKINGKNPWDLIVHDNRFYKRLFKDVERSLGETYMEGWWDCEKLDDFFFKIFQVNLEQKFLTHPTFWRTYVKQQLYASLRKFFNYQTKRKALDVGKQHYDIGNDLYQIMLDQSMIYTCGYWEKANTLDEAQEAKLELTCQKLQLKPGMRLLDIGCGWGGLAKYAAIHYGVSVVGITISNEQLKLGQEFCQGLDVELKFMDYRDLITTNLKFDRIVSLGMFEHVGCKNHKIYMKSVAHCLKDNGLFLLHTIGGNQSTSICDSRWMNTYIFPNGQIPSITQIGNSIERLFVMEDWHNFGSDYDQTLLAWHQNFNQNWDKISQHYDERFRRMWNYYLLSCAASFRARQNQLWQVVLSKQGIPNGYKRTY